MRRIQPRRCVVIGAGVLGASVAARLAGAGMSVTLLEADQPGRGTSRWSFAWVNSNDKGPRAYHDLNQAGIRAWAELAPGLDGAAWYRPAGHVELAADGPGLAARVDRLTQWGYPARLITGAEALRLEPALLPPGPGASAAWFPAEAYLLTEPLIERLVASATAHGATVLTGDRGRVTGLDPGTPGRMTGLDPGSPRTPGRVTGLDPGSPRTPGRVHTAAGEVLAADEVVCCAGRWTPQLAALASPACPVPLVTWDTPGSPAPALIVRVGPVGPEGPVRLIHTPQLALRPHSGGLLHLEAPDAAVDLHTPETELRRWAGELLGRARRTVRGLDDAAVVGYQVCVRPMPADGQSIAGRLPGAEWLYVAVTHSGVTLAAHLSRLIAAELEAGTPRADLAPYRPGRFAGTAAAP
ncbi:MAG TPA: FAD-dependent oxidoreductase [Streptosporangiaceae bacterium]|nr:FAD-dependent oxidoreductase [Streptosporangiaceae bacterium]